MLTQRKTDDLFCCKKVKKKDGELNVVCNVIDVLQTEIKCDPLLN